MSMMYNANCEESGLIVRRSWLSLDDKSPFEGLFTRKAYHEGDLVCIYSGQVYRTAEAMRIPDKSYLMRLGEQCYVDARTHGYDGGPPCLARFINDCINPAGYNVRFQKLPNAEPYPCTHVIALRDLSPGEEVFADYGKRYWAGCAIKPYRIAFMDLHLLRTASTQEMTRLLLTYQGARR